MNRLVSWLIAQSQRTPYFDIYNQADATLYMGRNWLMPRWLLRFDPDDEALKPLRWLPLAVRLHFIERADLDRDMHDHPSSFVSIVLRGGYVERLPTSSVPNWIGAEEDGHDVVRQPGSIALRRYTDRHRITKVLPDTVTLVLWFRKRQSWGFFTRRGKVHWRHYESVHNVKPGIERAA